MSSPPICSVQRCLGRARRVVGDHRVGGVEDALAGAVVLLHDDDRRLREHLLELHRFRKSAPRNFVDRVVRHQSFGDEVVGALRRRDRRRARRARPTPRRCHDVEVPLLVDHDHPATHRDAGRNGSELVNALPSSLAARRATGRTETSSTDEDALHGVGLPPPMSALDAASRHPRVPLRARTHAESDGLQRLPTQVVIPEQRYPVHRCVHRDDRRTALPRAADEGCQRHKLARSKPGMWCGCSKFEPVVDQELETTLVGVELLEEAVDELLVAHEAARTGLRFCPARVNERQRRQAVAGGERSFGVPRSRPRCRAR